MKQGTVGKQSECFSLQGLISRTLSTTRTVHTTLSWQPRSRACWTKESSLTYVSIDSDFSTVFPQVAWAGSISRCERRYCPARTHVRGEGKEKLLGPSLPLTLRDYPSTQICFKPGSERPLPRIWSVESFPSSNVIHPLAPLLLQEVTLTWRWGLLVLVERRDDISLESDTVSPCHGGTLTVCRQAETLFSHELTQDGGQDFDFFSESQSSVYKVE